MTTYGPSFFIGGETAAAQALPFLQVVEIGGDVDPAALGSVLGCVFVGCTAGAAGGGDPGGGDPGGEVVELPAAWMAAALPSSGYIGPVMAQLALLRGAAAVYDAGGLLIGGARLIGPAGKVFAFSSQGAADLWAAINKARGLREVELMAALDVDKAAVYRGRKAAALEKIGAAVVNAAGRMADAARRAALLAESSWCLVKWA